MHRDWRVAALLSIVPGLGQLYNGQIGKALRLMLGTVVTIVASLTLFIGVASRSWSFDALGAFLPLLFLLVVVLFLTIFVYGIYLWGSAAYDAAEAARAIGRGETPSPRICFFHL